MTRLILASASGSRANMLRNAGISFDVVPALVDEEAIKDSMLAANQPHRVIADALAELKAVRVSSSNPGALVIGADQVLSFAGELVSKCATMEEARALLSKLRGKNHDLFSAAVLAKDGAPIWRHVERNRMTMYPVSDGFIDNYLALKGENLLSGVGCYRLEDEGAQFFSNIDGDYFAILGLPLIPLLSALREQGVIPK
ncbi:MAG TPA: Maf family protein [Rhizomicrobium sp.]|jgi:septum formation protein